MVSCSSRNTANNWAWTSSASLPGGTIKLDEYFYLASKTRFFLGHACGLPRPGSAPDLKYFTHIVQRYAKIRWWTTTIVFLTWIIRCSELEACSPEDCDPYTSVYDTSTFCLIGWGWKCFSWYCVFSHLLFRLFVQKFETTSNRRLAKWQSFYTTHLGRSSSVGK